MLTQAEEMLMGKPQLAQFRELWFERSTPPHATAPLRTACAVVSSPGIASARLAR